MDHNEDGALGSGVELLRTEDWTSQFMEEEKDDEQEFELDLSFDRIRSNSFAPLIVGNRTKNGVIGKTISTRTKYRKEELKLAPNTLPSSSSSGESDGDDDGSSSSSSSSRSSDEEVSAEKNEEEEEEEMTSGPVLKRRRKRKGSKTKKKWLKKHNDGIATFVKRKYFDTVLRFVATLREDDLGPNLKFSEEAKDMLYQYMYDSMSKLFHSSSEMKKHRMTEKSGKKLLGQDILLAMKSNAVEYGFMDPGEFMEKSHYTSILTFLETLLCLMTSSTNDDDDDEEEKEESDENNVQDGELEILDTGFYFKRFGLEVDYCRGVFDFQVDSHLKNGKSQKKEMSKTIFPTWYNNMEDFEKASEILLNQGNSSSFSTSTTIRTTNSEEEEDAQELESEQDCLLIGENVHVDDSMMEDNKDDD